MKKIFFSILMLSLNSVVYAEKIIKVCIINALPGSGKSEIRKFISSQDPEITRKNYGIAPMIEIDDFPYVFIMRRISDEAIKRNYPGPFFLSPAFSFRNPMDWGTLIHLINEDFDDIRLQRKQNPKSASNWIFKRLDKARIKAGLKPILKKIPKKIKTEIAKAIEKDAHKLLTNKLLEIEKAKNLKEKTIIIEFSRGGADCAPMPLPKPYGYQYSYSQLSPEILKNASILYIDISPEESRKKNEARANPNDPGSILNHAVPRAVMYMEYGLDDISYLLSQSNKPNTIKIKKGKNLFYLPLAKFNNRKDKTTFARKDPSLWRKEEIYQLESNLKKAFEYLKH